ncbi:hypothetical protein FOL47_007838 [Perkinsus chesapeaki]|uniref:Uncharacterized protein n=1 Tax=Perkinsus chesapeaki TaxID=330153 RepID=A0A7J6MW17_PERCH|nr:hypothetical protein FOL47_007838 [Perkinsus chesapeaki]
MSTLESVRPTKSGTHSTLSDKRFRLQITGAAADAMKALKNSSSNKSNSANLEPWAVMSDGSARRASCIENNKGEGDALESMANSCSDLGKQFNVSLSEIPMMQKVILSPRPSFGQQLLPPGVSLEKSVSNKSEASSSSSSENGGVGEGIVPNSNIIVLNPMGQKPNGSDESESSNSQVRR